MMGSENFFNIAWTAPSLIVCGSMLNQKLGSVAASKYFLLSLGMSWIFMSVFNPQSKLSGMRVPFPVKLDSFGPNNVYFMGADNMAASSIYMLLLYYRMWPVFFGFAAFDLAYYGPVGLGGASAAMVGALTML
mmetsp:Transcript_35786/g.48309  ORF Transcript_35786/g.48309 Transcript_35786/m.48309 type:complete len:133 (-) Transcript_35786:68-466(-)